jgi:hypothetical protein
MRDIDQKRTSKQLLRSGLSTWQREYKGARRLKINILANPKKSIVLIGLIAAIISCYPVVFFGMSFVSPALHRMPLLYNYTDSLPGFPRDIIVENVRGSDVGAAMWGYVPNTFVQYEAITLDFEFPFWTRYVGGGVPLFGQGESLIGDFLHWIPILLGGSAVGWDIKFVLSKAIFAVGMGLLIFRLTQNILASLLITASSCFLGFFAFRFNHPAFFVLTYAPWIVLQWDRLGELLALPFSHKRKSAIEGVLLAVVTFLQLNAGTPKEGVIAACFMHALGMIAFIDHLRHKRGWVQSFLIAIGYALAIVLISSPHWLLFLDTLSKSFTLSDTPVVDTFPLWKILGFFDNYFFQQIDGTLAPSTNIFVLLCVSSAIGSLRWHKSIKYHGVWLLFILSMSISYGVVPQFILVSIPFIKNLKHCWDIFSIPMMIFALILAGYGIHDYLRGPAKHKIFVHNLSLSILLGLWLVYVLGIHSGKTILFVMCVLIVIVTGIMQLRRQVRSDVWCNSTLIILACCFLLLHVRHGMHLMTGNVNIDLYVQNPTERANFSHKSTAVEYVNKRINEQSMPTRVIGEDMVMFPGTNSMFGIEGLVSVEPLRNEHFEKLLAIVDYPDMGWGWLRLISSNQIDDRAPSLDLLGVGYIFAKPGTQMPQSVKLVHSSDLDVWERETVWPRAFFVNQVFDANKPLKISHMPLAAVESQFIPQWMPMNTNVSYEVVPAQQYLLTNNTTKFTVDATGPGLIVLGETYYPEDFVAKINGKKVDYIRVNLAFKGIWVKEAGRCEVSFTYRPARLYQAMIVSLCGMFLLLVLSFKIQLNYAEFSILER